MAVLKLNILGIALVEMRHEWRIYLPWDDDCHSVRFKSPQHGIDVNLKQPDQRISIEVVGMGGSIPRPEAGEHFDEILDITRGEIHRNGIRLIGGWNERTALLTVSGGKYSSNLGDETYFVRNAAGNTQALGKVGLHGMITAEGGSFEVKAKIKGDEFSLIIREDAEITIDNDCVSLLNNDFRMFYECTFEDKSIPPEEFEIFSENNDEELPCNNFRSRLPIES